MIGKLKIITTCWNVEKWIETCIRSVILQTYTDWEMVIIDDCSKDKTYGIINHQETFLYEHIYFFSVAHAVAQCLSRKNDKGITEVLLYEDRFLKHLNDMTFYRNAGKIDLQENSRIYAVEYLWKIRKFTQQKNYRK